MFALIGLLLLLLSQQICADENIHNVVLSMTGDPNTMSITFMTKKSPENPVISYYVNKKSPSQIVGSSEDVTSFTIPTTTTIQYIVSIIVPVIQRGVLHTYKIAENASAPVWSSEYTFLPLPEGDDYPISLALFGDLGSYGSAVVHTDDPGCLTNWAAKRKFDMVFHYGDIAYDLASGTGDNAAAFMNNIMNISSIVPYHVGLGNHEYYKLYSLNYYEAYFKGQESIGTNSGSSSPLHWYSFDIGFAHMVMINSEVYCEDTIYIDQMYNWLDADLAAARTVPGKWIVMMMHRQMYDGKNSTFSTQLLRLGEQCNMDRTKCDITKACLSGENCKYSLGDMFDKYQVDIVFGGHKHYYTRNFPIGQGLIYENQDPSTYINPQYPVYILSGAAGVETSETTKNKRISVPNQSHPQYFGSTSQNTPAVYHNDEHSWSNLFVFNSTHMKMDQISVKSGDVIDSFWIVKDAKQPNWTTTLSFVLNEDSQLTCDR